MRKGYSVVSQSAWKGRCITIRKAANEFNVNGLAISLIQSRMSMSLGIDHEIEMGLCDVMLGGRSAEQVGGWSVSRLHLRAAVSD